MLLATAVFANDSFSLANTSEMLSTAFVIRIIFYKIGRYSCHSFFPKIAFYLSCGIITDEHILLFDICESKSFHSTNAKNFIAIIHNPV